MGRIHQQTFENQLFVAVLQRRGNDLRIFLKQQNLGNDATCVRTRTPTACVDDGLTLFRSLYSPPLGFLTRCT